MLFSLAILSLPSLLMIWQVPSPIISFEKTHHDFGRIAEGSKVSYRIEVSNVGDGALHIKDVKASCGCSGTAIGQSHIEPGEKTFIEIRFDAAGMMGRVHKSLQVLSNDTANPVATLAFEANIMRDVTPSATVVFFRSVPRDGKSTSSIFLGSGNGEPVTVTDASIPNAPHLSCETRKDGVNAILDVTIDGRLIPKRSSRGSNTLIVTTTSVNDPVLPFHMQWDTEPFIAATPSKILWAEAAGKELSAIVHLSNPRGRAFKVLDVKSSSPLVKLAAIPHDSAAEHRFAVALSSDAKAGGYNEVLTLALDDPDQPEFEIKVVAALK